jgi:transcriptional regulator GlxA family with amidase domain
MPNIIISILAIEETMIYTLAGPYDIFSTAAICSQQMAPKKPAFVTQTSIVGLNKGALTCYNGLTIECQQSLDEVDNTDLIILPSIEFLEQPFLRKYPELQGWLTKHYKRGTVIATVCAGAFLLAETGLLDGKIATTHWAFADDMQAKFPDVEVHSDKIITEQDNLICAGGATSWQDLVSYLIEKYSSIETAKHIDQFFLLNSHQEGQLPYKLLKSMVRHEDKVIKESQELIEGSLVEEELLANVTQKSGLPERTFKRRFKVATKQTPNEYIQNVRIDTAKHLLLVSSSTVQEIAEQVGLMDGSYFRRLFKRKTGLSAQDFRRSFASSEESKKVLRK